MAGTVNLQTMAKERGVVPRANVPLVEIFGELFKGIKLNKDQKARNSSWDTEKLTLEQQEVAGILRASLNLALRKRPVSTEQVDGAIERIEEKLLNLGQREIASHRIGEMVMRELKKLDKVAYIRFASVYRSFEDIDEFKTLVDEVRK